VSRDRLPVRLHRRTLLSSDSVALLALWPLNATDPFLQPVPKLDFSHLHGREVG